MEGYVLISTFVSKADSLSCWVLWTAWCKCTGQASEWSKFKQWASPTHGPRVLSEYPWHTVHTLLEVWTPRLKYQHTVGISSRFLQLWWVCGGRRERLAGRLSSDWGDEEEAPEAVWHPHQNTCPHLSCSLHKVSCRTKRNYMYMYTEVANYFAMRSHAQSFTLTHA